MASLTSEESIASVLLGVACARLPGVAGEIRDGDRCVAAAIAIPAAEEGGCVFSGLGPLHEKGDSGNISSREGEPVAAVPSTPKGVRGPLHVTSDPWRTGREGESLASIPKTSSPSAPSCPRGSSHGGSKGGLKLTRGWVSPNGEPSASTPKGLAEANSSQYENGGVEPGGR